MTTLLYEELQALIKRGQDEIETLMTHKNSNTVKISGDTYTLDPFGNVVFFIDGLHYDVRTNIEDFMCDASKAQLVNLEFRKKMGLSE